MNRRGFLKALGFGAGAVAVGKLPDLSGLQAAAPPAGPVPVDAWRPPPGTLFASGGYCAPMSPYYEIGNMTQRPYPEQLAAHRGMVEFRLPADARREV